MQHRARQRNETGLDIEGCKPVQTSDTLIITCLARSSKPPLSRLSFLEAVMNSIRNGLGMRKTGSRRGSGQPENPYSNAVFTQVHNTL